MTSKEWQTLLKKTNNLQIPEMQENIIPADQLDTIRQLLRDVVIAFSEQNKPHYGLKIFTDGMQNNRYNERLIMEPPHPEETLEEWGRHMFDGHPYGLIMNLLELYSNKLVQTVAKVVTPLLKEHGIPPLGLSMLFFMGDYGFTPFGVHKGTPGEDGFLFHLGPGIKDFYTWDTDKYNELTGFAPSFKDVDKLLPYATKHTLHPGDVMFIPSDIFHVADTPEFSMSLVLDYRKPPKEHFIKELINRIQFRESARRTFIEPVNVAVTTEELEKRAADYSLQEELREAWLQLQFSLKSNGGFYEPSIRKRTSSFSNEPFKLREPFQIECIEEDEMVTCFARGHQLKFPNEKKFKKLISDLNEGKTFTMEEIIERLSPDFDMQELYGWFAPLAQTDILKYKRIL